MKIFLWFWMAVLVGSIAFVTVAVCLPSQTIVGRAAKYFTFNLATTGRLGIDLYEKGGPSDLDTLLGSIETISAFNLYIVTAEGTPLRDIPLPSDAGRLAQRALNQGSVQVKGWTTHPLIAQPLTSGSGQPYAIVLELPAGWVQLLGQMYHAMVLRFTAALLASGLVCFMMVKYLTSPIRKLQSAVRKFAQGDLSVRVAAKIGSRKDEIADLGRDFDSMAGRIETLMHAHERLLRDVAHELRSPLTRLNVALEISRKHSNVEMVDSLDRISSEANQLSRLITQVLALSRLENADVELHLEPLCLEKLIHRIVNDANFEGQSRSLPVTFHYEESATLMVDGRLIHSAIENVVRNALRFTPPGSQVEITQAIKSYNGENMAIVVISDQGPGVPQEALNDLFNPFFRVADKQRRTSGGAGIGLAIAFHAVNLHQGAISAMNRNSGGLTVEIRLPMNVKDRSGEKS
jgi:two-component system sensor histidine kinase CpxA